MDTTTCQSSKILRLIILLLLDGFCTPVTTLSAQKKKKKSKKKEDITLSSNIVITQEDQPSSYRIVIPSAPTRHELKASKVLQDYLLQISGTALPIIQADKSKSDYEIVLGQNERLDELSIGINLNDLKQDGFLIKTDNKRQIGRAHV